MRLLLIEDDAEAAKYLARALSETGHEVEIAADGRMRQQRALAGEHQLIIADRNLPNVDGSPSCNHCVTAGTAVPGDWG